MGGREICFDKLEGSGDKESRELNSFVFVLDRLASMIDYTTHTRRLVAQHNQAVRPH